ncbi:MULTISPECIES: hypothetical protein [Halomonadaceae]|uniref:Bcr/CflA family drug resistance efflux transporter n=1 Tax=Modicisalibacter zincidurans TaxID=1178777 RepID=A0ABP9RMU6_9GAMM|nr:MULTISPECIES: hypothetical protein [Halomonas]MCD6009127.1 hypothetical protein [Halomonas sp. IOP_31]
MVIPPTRASLMWLLVASVMLTPLAIDIYLPSLPVMAADLGQPATALQIIITLLLSSVGLGQIVVGPLTDRRRPALLVGSAL